jgi:hypothetical protein
MVGACIAAITLPLRIRSPEAPPAPSPCVTGGSVFTPLGIVARPGPTPESSDTSILAYWKFRHDVTLTTTARIGSSEQALVPSLLNHKKSLEAWGAVPDRGIAHNHNNKRRCSRTQEPGIADNRPLLPLLPDSPATTVPRGPASVVQSISQPTPARSSREA